MSPDTPLHEVAHYLSQETANRLLRETVEVQMAVLTAVRSFVTMIEADTVLDPIEFQDKLHKFVHSFLLAYRGERSA
jgi:hypothetical protein